MLTKEQKQILLNYLDSELVENDELYKMDIVRDSVIDLYNEIKDNINSVAIIYNVNDLKEIAENNDKVLNTNQAVQIIKDLNNDENLIQPIEDYVSSIVLNKASNK